MFYHLVWVRSNRYHGQEPLTYAFPDRLVVGSVVKVELQKSLVLGIVSGLTTKPRFMTKEIVELLNIPPLASHLIKLAEWLKDYYPAPLGITTQQFLPAVLSSKQIAKDGKASFKPIDVSVLPPLTGEQLAALDKIKGFGTYLIHGKTGSGKTRLYIELAIKSLNQGKSAIILTPEISLTSQIADSFKEVFNNRVVVTHSKQPSSVRQKAWLDCLRSDQPLVVIGPRSALFYPVKKLGLVVMDEAHEVAYKQEQAPQYLTSRVAGYLTKLTHSYLLMGSATPLITDYYLSIQRQRPIIKLTKLARPQSFAVPKLLIVDRKEHSLFNRSNYLSQPLIEMVDSSLSKHEQSLLYLNRRGTARLVLCENCGWQAICPNCDIPLTYHGDKHQLRCHSCNYYSNVPNSCPSCNYPSVVYKTAGTKAIVDEAKRLFPRARIARFDTDNTLVERFEHNYLAARDGEIDILVGTQMIGKGLDLPKLSTVGIVLADTSLYLPDFTSHERTFQLISQVIGRIGRGHVSGQAIIQTYHPEHNVFKYATTGDYEAFYKTELDSRKQFIFPPFCYLLKLTTRKASLDRVESTAQELKSNIQRNYKVRVEGPAPSFYERVKGKYQWQLVVKALKRTELLRIIAGLPAGWSYDIDPVDLL